MHEFWYDVMECTVGYFEPKYIETVDEEVFVDLELGLGGYDKFAAGVDGDPFLSLKRKQASRFWELVINAKQQSMLFYGITRKSFILDMVAVTHAPFDEVEEASAWCESWTIPLMKKREVEGPRVRFDFSHNVQHTYEDDGVVRTCCRKNLLHLYADYEFEPDEYEALHPRQRSSTV